MNQLSLIISFLSFVVAGIALGWNIYRDCVERGRLKIIAYVADVIIPGYKDQPQVISVRVTNIGKKPIVVDGHSFLMKDGTSLMPSDSYATFHNRRLEPGDYLTTTLSNPVLLNLLDKIDNLYGFYVIDSFGKRWWLSDNQISELIGSLKKLKRQ